MDHPLPEISLSTPVIFMIFNRPDLTSLVFEEIAKAKPKTLLILADGPRNSEEAQKCLEARRVTERVSWDCELFTNFADRNMGCKSRITSGLDWAFSIVEEAIVLEDDCLPTPSFFTFCEKLLKHYRLDNRIMHISGNNFQPATDRSGFSYYFSKYSHIWGWATWRRAWRYYDKEMRTWPHFRNANLIRVSCEDPVEQVYWTDLFDQTFSGSLDTWDLQWLYACWSQSGLSILPTSNLVSNIGFRPDATHTPSPNLLAHLPTKDIWDMSHPSFVILNKEADDFTFDNVFGGRLLRKNKTIVGRVRHFISKLKRAVLYAFKPHNAFG